MQQPADQGQSMKVRVSMRFLAGCPLSERASEPLNGLWCAGDHGDPLDELRCMTMGEILSGWEMRG